MNNTEQSYQNENNNDLNLDLNKKRENLQKLTAEYLAIRELAKEKQQQVETLIPDREKIYMKIYDLESYRDDLNTTVRHQRKEVREADKALQGAQADLAYAQSELIKYEVAVDEARKQVARAKRTAKPFANLWRSAQTELQNTKKMLAETFEHVKAAQQEYLLAGGKLTSEEKSISPPEDLTKGNQTNPWLSGTFYLFALIVIIGIIVFLNYLSLQWYMILGAVIIALFGLLIIAALQLRNDKNLSEENFVKLMLEVIKQLPLLRKP
jgi:hypothetical protein